MPGNILTTASTVMCMHGGQASLLTSNTRVYAGGSPVLLETDIHPVTGCPFYMGSNYSPCVRIEWSQGSSRVSSNGVPLLIQSSIGNCLNVQNAPQGVATIVNTQIKVSAQ